MKFATLMQQLRRCWRRDGPGAKLAAIVHYPKGLDGVWVVVEEHDSPVLMCKYTLRGGEHDSSWFDPRKVLSMLATTGKVVVVLNCKNVAAQFLRCIDTLLQAGVSSDRLYVANIGGTVDDRELHQAGIEPDHVLHELGQCRDLLK